MSKSQVKSAPKPITNPPTETVATDVKTPAVTKAPRAKVHKSVLSGPAYARLVAANAVLITIPSKGFLHDRVTSQLGKSIGAKELAGVLPGLVAGWGAFDSGYLAGKSASYGSCAVITRGKKAKTNPAFLWAVPVEGGEPVIYTAMGEVWVPPTGTSREAGVYAQTLMRAKEFFAPAEQVSE